MATLHSTAAGLAEVLTRLSRDLPDDVEIGTAVAFEGNVVVTTAAVYVLLDGQDGPGPSGHGRSGAVGVLRAVQQSPTSYQVTRWARGHAMESRWWAR